MSFSSSSSSRPRRSCAPRPGSLCEFPVSLRFLNEQLGEPIIHEIHEKKKRKNRDERNDEDEWDNFEEIVDVEDEDDEDEDEKVKPRKKMKKVDEKEKEEYPEDFEEQYEEIVAPPIVDGILPAPPSNWYYQRTRIDLTCDPPHLNIDLVADEPSQNFDYFFPFYHYGVFDKEDEHEYFHGDKNFID